MTPQEKAYELLAKFMHVSYEIGDKSSIYTATAIMHAHYCVDEIIKSREESASFDDMYYRTSPYHSPHPMYLSYWIQVKQELNKL